MSAELWSWLLTAVGLTCFWLAGLRVWWAWYVGLAGQVAWLAYSLTTQQWGFLVGVVAYSIIYGRNAAKWTRDRKRKAAPVVEAYHNPYAPPGVQGKGLISLTEADKWS